MTSMSPTVPIPRDSSPGALVQDKPATAAETTRGGKRVAYVLTHYPRVSLTFVHDEIAMIERLGWEVHPFAMNQPSAADLLGTGFSAERDRTLYLKADWVAAAAAFLGLLGRHPLGTAAIAASHFRAMVRGPGTGVRALAHLFQAALLSKQCRRRSIDHIHAHFGLAPATIAWLGSRLARLGGDGPQFSFTIHGFQDFIEPSTTRLDLKAAAAAFVACISDFTRSQLCLVSAPETWSKFEVVRCGIDLERIAWRQPSRPPDKVRLVTVGRLSPEKGFAILLEALAALDPARVSIACRIIGDGPLRASLEAQSVRLGLGGRVSFAGELLPEDVAKELDRSDIFCLPSFSEGLPVSIMEAMARGVPVIATSIAGIPELAVDGVTARLVPPANVPALCAAIEALASDFDVRIRMATCARQIVSERHDRVRSGQQLAALFERALA